MDDQKEKSPFYVFIAREKSDQTEGEPLTVTMQGFRGDNKAEVEQYIINHPEAFPTHGFGEILVITTLTPEEKDELRVQREGEFPCTVNNIEQFYELFDSWDNPEIVLK